MKHLRGYLLITAAYWAFTLTDGALRMLVLLEFHRRGLDPVSLAFLFLLYELCGVFTNLLGAWLGSRHGLRWTLYAGLGTQVVALCALSFVDLDLAKWLVVALVMGLQALSGIAKDLTKMSSKSAVKLFAKDSEGNASQSILFRWVAVLTGSKNALKGVGFFVGGFLLDVAGFRPALWIMAGGLAATLVLVAVCVREDIGRSKRRPSSLGDLLSHSRAVRLLSLARVFLFGSRDVWFVVGAPVFLHQALGWTFTQVGTFFAAWVIGYGIVQAVAPRFAGGGRAGKGWVWTLTLFTTALAAATQFGTDAARTGIVLAGLVVFGLLFAVNSSVHSYLILAYSDEDEVAQKVGFYYMANAVGRLLGTLLSGLLYLWAGLPGCLWGSAAMLAVAASVSLGLPSPRGRSTE